MKSSVLKAVMALVMLGPAAVLAGGLPIVPIDKLAERASVMVEAAGLPLTCENGFLWGTIMSQFPTSIPISADGKAVECTSGGAFSVSGEPLTDIQMREAVADTLEGHWRGAAGQRKSGGGFPVIDAGAVQQDSALDL